MKKHLLPLMVVLCAVTFVPRPASGQFESPNRSFHNAAAFRLEGKHQALACEACHLNGQFHNTPNTCYDCHWIRRKDDRYQTRLGSQCEQCHRPTSWTAVQWNHEAQSGVSLNQGHRQVACESCHRGERFDAVSVTCVDCHQKDYSAASAPNHASAGFPTSCDSCHRPSESTWRNAGGGGFSHTAIFPLVGLHATQSCVACHRNANYKGTAHDCVGCHLARYNTTTSPNHAAAGFPTACETCHQPTSTQWTGASFNHASAFALVGRHATLTCANCHVNSVYKGAPRDCVGCHQALYNATRNPAHAPAGFPTTCDTCHRPTDTQWTGASFNHGSAFALVGRHASLACANCHGTNAYRGTPRTCVGCHQAKYNATTNPRHTTAGFGTTCETCHRATDTNWQQGTFSHSRFPLTSRHNAACTQCHTTPGNYGVFSCTVCHSRSEADREHRNRNGYVYDSNACYSCHPTGRD